MNDRQRHARDAIRQFTRDVTVLMQLGRPPRLEEVRFGSGIVICGASGRAHVLTARHNFPFDGSWRPTSIAAAHQRVNYQNAVAEVLYAPDIPGRTGDDYVDVALLILNDKPAQELSTTGIGADHLAIDSMLTEDAYSVLAGYPTGVMKHEQSGPKRFDVDIGLLHHETTGLRRDHLGRICVDWRNTGEMEVMTHDFSPTGSQPAVKEPYGISGGGYWKYDPNPGDGLWSARTHGKLVGVAVAWNGKDTEFVESVESFGDWLKAELAAR